MEDERDTLNLRSRRKKSSLCLSCCFNGHHLFDSTESSSSSSLPSPKRSPGSWFKSKTHEVPEIKGKYKSFISKMGRQRRHASADFSYDPLSYALNFEDEESADVDEMQQKRNFMRLPSLPRTPRRLVNADMRVPRRNVVEVGTTREEMVVEGRSGEVITPRAVRRSLEEEGEAVVSRPSREILV